MALHELEVIASEFSKATCPEDVFGPLSSVLTRRSDAEKQLKQVYWRIAKAVHPDAHNGDRQSRDLAEKLFLELEIFYTEAKERLSRNTYGSRKPIPSRVPIVIQGKYVKERTISGGDVADVHIVSLESSSQREDLILKVARTADDNDLLRAEAESISRLRNRLSDLWKECVPEIRESFLLDEGKSYDRRHVNVQKRFTGFIDCQEIYRRLPQGIDGRTLAWMWKRLIVMLEWTGKIGLVHGAVLPPHVMFYPDNDGKTIRDKRKHSIRLVDWCYAVDYKTRTRLSAWVPKWTDFYAPEVLGKKTLSPQTDLYMGAKTMLYLTGGLKSVRDEKFPIGIPIDISQAILSCLEKDISKRPQSLGRYFEEFNDLLRDVYGAPKYHEFIVPGAKQ